MAKSKRKTEEQEHKEGQAHWNATCDQWMKCRAALPDEALEMLRGFHNLYFGLMQTRNLSPAVALVGLSHLFAEVVNAHLACPRPETMSEEVWGESIYDAIIDCVAVAVALKNGTQDGSVVAGNDGKLRPATRH